MARVDIRFDALDVGAGEIARLTGLLDAEEAAHAARFRFARDRRRFVVRRGRLREHLGELVGERPERLRFVRTAFGKPVLAGHGVHFSAAHSGERMMIATGAAPLGCDLERIDPALDWPPLVDLFADAERAALAALPAGEARAAFFACWARKEAFVKARGLGLSHPLTAFAVSVGPDARLTAGGEGWAIAPVACSGHAAAVVARDTCDPLTIRLAPPENPLQRAA